MSQISNVTFKTLEEEQTESNASKRKIIINIRVEINEIQNRNNRENETRCWYFEKINKI